jgi:hypothetical protein
MEFKEIKNVNIETIGSLSQITRPCPIKYKSMKAQHEQVKVDRSQTLTEFIKEDQVNLTVYLVVLCIVSSVDKLYGSLLWKSNYCFICTWYYSNTPRFTGQRYFIFIGFVILVYIYIKL